MLIVTGGLSVLDLFMFPLQSAPTGRLFFLLGHECFHPVPFSPPFMVLCFIDDWQIFIE
jgi:hypothetical protein